jgi:mono/diheme cytochrome c family protein
MAANLQFYLRAIACVSMMGLTGFGLAQPTPTNRPYLAKDVQQAIDFLATWPRVASGQDYFKDASFVGSQSCGAGCHDQQVKEWQKTWHSRILSADFSTVVGDFNNATVSFEGVRAVTKGTPDSELGKLQNIPVKVEVRTETSGGKFFFVIIDPKDVNSPKGGQRYEVVLVVGGKWQQTYHVRPVDKDGNPGQFYFPAPIRWSVNPDKNANPSGHWELVNFQPESWVWSDGGLGTPRKPDELPVARFAEAKCMGCHTTGFNIEQSAESPHWKMVGSALPEQPGRQTGELAVGCERCHGPGSKHIAAAKLKEAQGSKLDPARDQMWIVHGLKDLSLDQQNQICGQCHARVGNKDQRDLAFQNRLFVGGAAVSGDRGFLPGDSNLMERSFFWSYANPNATPNQGIDTFWPDGRGKKSRTQWQDHTNGAHAVRGGASCMTCHSFHGDAVEKDPQQESKLRQPVKELCETCHNQSGAAKQPNKEMYAGGPNAASSQHADQGVQCVDCHMGAVGQRMSKTAAGAAAFDVSFHGTSIVLPESAASQAGAALGLADMRGNCEVCHTDKRVMANGTEPPPKSAQELLDYVHKIKASIKTAMDRIEGRVKSNKSQAGKTNIQLSNAQANLRTILLDGSMGVHNSRVDQNGTVSHGGGIGECLRVANLWAELACRDPAAQCTGEPYNPVSGPITDPNPAVCLAN